MFGKKKVPAALEQVLKGPGREHVHHHQIVRSLENSSQAGPQTA